MKYKHVNTHTRNQEIAQLFGYYIDVPDRFGKVLASHKVGNIIHCICENGIHLHKTRARDPVDMKFRGLQARNILGRAKLP